MSSRGIDQLWNQPAEWASLPRTSGDERRGRPTLLICGNGLSGEAVPMLDAAGFNVIVLTEFPSDIGLHAAEAVVPVDSKNPHEVMTAVDRLGSLLKDVCGVFSLCWDSPISVATLTNRFSLPGISVEVARIASDKAARSRTFEASGVSSPRFVVCSSEDECVDARRSLSAAVVVKPLTLSSSRGVTLCRSSESVRHAYRRARDAQCSGTVIVNEFIAGVEYSLEGYMSNGTLSTSGFSDREFLYEEFAPFFVERGDILPTVTPPSVQNRCRSIIERAAISLGINDSPVKSDILIDGDGDIYVLELTPRMGGPRFGTEIVPLSNGTSLLRAVVAGAVGEPVDLKWLEPTARRGVVFRSLLGYSASPLDGIT